MDIGETRVYSAKYDIHGVIRNYFNMVTKLFFTYDGREIVIGVRRHVLDGETYEDLGREIIETYVSALAVPQEGRKQQLHYWYIDEHIIDEKANYIAHGIVTGHPNISDTAYMHTSPVKAMRIDEDEGVLIVTTLNSVYHCPLEYCLFRKQEEFPDIIAEYKSIKKKYNDKIRYPSIEPGKVLLVLANFSYYYFHSLYYIPKNSKNRKPQKYLEHPHIGTTQDSYAIQTLDGAIDIRYCPHFQNIEFYMTVTNSCPFFIENIGDSVIFVVTYRGTLKLNPGERKEMIEDNFEKEVPRLPDGDLYLAGT